MPDADGVTEAVPAATVLLLRDDPVEGLHVLMVRRNAKLAFAGGMWVFPGGRVDPADWPDASPGSGELDRDAEATQLAAARRAAVREAAEEAGLALREETLVAFSHWTPPPQADKRFATWFFAAPAPLGEVTIDDGEIKAHQWTSPMDMLRRFKEDQLELIPPTWITLAQLTSHPDVASVMRIADGREPAVFVTRIALGVDGPVALYDGDAGYLDGDADRPGDRHRLVMAASGWSYTTRDGVVIAP
jgi:8-oxo-dGTP pyrophosphatase MutT (NUDIX family)